MTISALKWYTSSEQAQWVARKAPEQAPAGTIPNLTITPDSYQTLEGFGGCFNELGYEAMSVLPEEERAKLMHALFHPQGEQRLSICRLPIGASDYALEWYSHNETDGDYAMEHFSIERDRKYLIPYIKEALALNPELKLFASPWSPPTWMKFPKAYNYGTLRWEPEILAAYALYFVKFVQAYREEGITIHQVHVQNEVVADQKFPSCVWTGEQLREFIRDYLGPAFEAHGLDTEIWLGTINAPDPWEELIKQKTSDYDAYAGVVLSDPEAYKYVKGVGYQWAGKYAIQRTVQSYPELRYMQTENECGDGQNTWFYAKYVYNLYQHYFSNGVNAYIYWNMVLAPHGRSTWGWEQNSMLTVDPATRLPVANPEYYVMKHFSRFAMPGSVRAGLIGPWSGHATAFRTPAGALTLVIANLYKESRTLHLEYGAALHSFVLEAESFHTIVLEK
ncbi:glycoside hydrolase family 30 beta sandwich domain-containing protein [Paenibacillus sp. FSL R7-0337]|uniref:glycoside hydrolase family 30 protein n=1 Tax=Paenibacillus sp. FSL R7-0337 TaxID=1926588 RepID=UPI00096CFA84|nr:glycoside hydrolase family 30 beta sandwich domain-containing protein [Paenibacillus sp. FSL R7-0337]OMF98560.1 glycosyl hydrolase [Paenibacillus sp. FSL R7-0337]